MLAIEAKLSRHPFTLNLPLTVLMKLCPSPATIYRFRTCPKTNEREMGKQLNTMYHSVLVATFISDILDVFDFNWSDWERKGSPRLVSYRYM